MFITSQAKDTDFQTAMAKALDRAHYRQTGRSLLTGLRAFMHSGRPNFSVILSGLRDAHPRSDIVLYTCGPPNLVESLEAAKADANQDPTLPPISHIYSVF